MKKVKFLFSIVCLMALSLGFVSCEDDEPSIYTYIATGEISATGDDALSALSAIPDYNTAISSVVGMYTTEKKDAEVLKACDEIYQKHRANHPSWKGKVEIRRYEGTMQNPNDELSYEVIKTYSYDSNFI